MELFHQAETWVAVAFVLFVLILLRFSWTRITSLLDKRTESIRAELDEARNLREETQALLADYQRRKRNVETEALELINQAKEKAERANSDEKRKLNEILDRKTKTISQRIAMAETQAIHELRLLATDAGVSAAEKIIKKNVVGPIAKSMLDEAIAEIKTIPK